MLITAILAAIMCALAAAGALAAPNPSGTGQPIDAGSILTP